MIFLNGITPALLQSLTHLLSRLSVLSCSIPSLKFKYIFPPILPGVIVHKIEHSAWSWAWVALVFSMTS